MPRYIPREAKNTFNEIRAILEHKGFRDSPLQLDQGQLWGVVKDNYPEQGVQLHVRAFYTGETLEFRAHTEPTRFAFEHLDERLRSYREGTRLFMEIMNQYGVEIRYEGNVLHLYVTPERAKTLTPWVPLAIIVLVFLLAVLLGKPPKE